MTDELSPDAVKILDALIAMADDRIWASELSLFSGGRRIDFWTLEPVRSKHYRTVAYEIKVSRGDFLRDTEEKQAGAILWSDRFWYVTPPGLIAKAELPAWAGLQEFDGKRFSIIRKAPPRVKAEPTWEFVASLIRNSGDCRRDVGLMKAQLAFYQQREERERGRRKIHTDWQMDRWLRRANAAKKEKADVREAAE